MVKAAFRLRFAFVLALLCAGGLHAKDLAAYRVGDTATENITTPVALDVIDANATAARKAAEALKTPAIFRSYPDASITNTMVAELQAGFAATRSNFLAALKAEFPAAPLDSDTIASARFTGFLADFNGKSKSFPVDAKLAASWAAGDAGLDTETQFIAALLKMTHRAIRADDLPEGFTLGDTLMLVPAASPNENVTLVDAEQRGKIITQNNMTSLSRLQMLFRREFSEDEQPLARSLSVFLQPNCAPDASLTQQARDRDVRQLVVVDHYDAGQLIVQRGATIDPKIKAALEALNEKMMPDQLNRQIVAAREQMQQQQLQIRARNEWLVAALAAVSVVSVAAFFFVWQQLRSRRQSDLLPALVGQQNIIQTELAPQLAQVIKDALVQELAAQRHELLSAQQCAAAEIADLVRRLDRLQAPMHERLQIYEQQIQKLEKELAVRTEENRELLQMKIEMIRHQLASERARSGVGFVN
jgi:7TM-HD extracellular